MVCRLRLSTYMRLSTVTPAFRRLGRQTFSKANVFHSDRSTTVRGRVPLSIWEKVTAQLHNQSLHPLNILRREIEAHFEKTYPSLFELHSSLSPIVTTEQCFDHLLIPPSHTSRSPTDTYYIDKHTLLRPHMTVHDVPLLRGGSEAFLLCGDVYRRDSVDRTHYPVFHQIDAARLFPCGTSQEYIVDDLKSSLSGLAHHLFGPETRMRWVEGSFPFTSPSFELEIFWRDEWLEVLGCGLIRRGVLQNGNVSNDVNGWAFGLGLERLAMVLFEIPDIRLFWSRDTRFLDQFKDGDFQRKFKPFSAYPSIEKDISFWIGEESTFHENDFHEIVRSLSEDLVESVSMVDRYKRAERTSLCFRIIYRSMERSLTHVEINELHDSLREFVAETLPVTLR